MTAKRPPMREAKSAGVFRKFKVTRTDGSSARGGKHHDCEYFVLDVDHDPHAQAALTAYANACAPALPLLAFDMRLRYRLDGTHDPIDMVLHCPACGLQHIDAPEETDPATWTAERYGDWTNPPHRSHLCHGCGHVWRPADVPTNGVQAVTTRGKADSPIRTRSAYEFAVLVRVKQGWSITSGPCPVLYTDEINGRQVLRDDVWLCKTEHLTQAGRAIVAELVACKDLKDEESRLRGRREVSIQRKPDAVAHVNSMRDDYNRRKPLAWAAARAWLKEHTK